MNPRNRMASRLSATGLLLLSCRIAGAADLPGRDTPVPCIRRLSACNWTEGWRTFGDGEILAEENGVRVKWTPQKARDKFTMHELDFTLRGVGLPTGVSAEVELVRGGKVLFAPVFSGKSGWLMLQFRELQPGTNPLVWRLPDEAADPATAYVAPLFLQEMRFVSIDGTPAEFVLRKLGARQTLPATDALRVDVETGDPLHLVRPSDVSNAVLRVRNDAETNLTAVVTANIHNLFDDFWGLSKTVAVPAQGSVDIPLGRTSMPKGIWWVDYRVKAAGADRYAIGRRSFCVLDPVGQTPLAKDPRQRPKAGETFLFGIMSHSDKWGAGTRELEIRAAALCGAKMMRTDVGWFTIQPNSSNDWQWQRADVLVDGYLEAGIEVEFMMGYSPRWAAPEATRTSKNWVDWYRAVPDFDAWGNFVQAVAERYKGRVRFLEVWNEPDLDFFRGSAADYLQMLRIAHDRIRAVDPQIMILNGGLGTLGYHPTAKPGFQMEVMTKGQSLVDIHAIHEHCAFPEFERLLDGPHAEIRKRLDPPKPLFCNETALASLGGERDQADALCKKLLFAWARGASAYVWYDLRNDGFSTTSVEHNYGMLTHDFYPKAVYPAYNTLVRTLRGKQFVRQLQTGPGVYAFQYADAKETVLAAWLEGEKKGERGLTLSGVPPESRVRDAMDNELPGRPAASVLPLSISRTPCFLVMPGARVSLSVTNDLVALALPVPTEDGKGASIACSVWNPARSDLRASLELRPEKGFSVEQAVQELTVPAGATAQASFRVIPPTNAVLSQAILFAPVVRYTINGEWRGSVCSPAHLIVRRERFYFDENFPAFALETHDSVVNFQEKDPTLTAGGWLGPDDLSARVYLFKQDGSLVVRTHVRDDIHDQKGGGTNAWNGDSIQFALALPGQTGYWEMSLYRSPEGQPGVHVSSAPSGFADIRDRVRLTIAPREGGLSYEAQIPCDALGATFQMLDSGIRFSLIVNDNDGQGRKGWAQVSGGIGEIKAPARFPIVSVPTKR